MGLKLYATVVNKSVVAASETLYVEKRDEMFPIPKQCWHDAL